MPLEITMAEDAWADLPFDAEHVARQAHAAVLAHGTGLQPADDICLQLDADAAIAELNGQFRGKPAPTNVLAFPAPALPDGVEQASRHLGDIILARETVLREAEDQGKPAAHHVAHLTIHGVLHLLGHDHQQADEADAMEALETQILQTLGIPDPYKTPSAGPKPAIHGEHDD